jgi:hypothetical protein
MNIRAFSFFAVFWLLCGFPAQAAPADIIYDQPLCAKLGSEFVAEGSITGAGVVTLVLRIDDVTSNSYATRVNLERALSAGPFHWRVSLDGLRTSGDGSLNSCAIKRAMLFIGAGEGTLELKTFETVQLEGRADGIFAYDLGPDNSPLMTGFSRLSAGDTALSGAALHDIRRPGPDALIGDGVNGIEKVHLNVPNGRWRVTLWTEDPGEWETLPHPFSRKITANGTTLLDINLTYEQWVADRYLAGKLRRFQVGDTAWQAIGRHRGGRVEAIINVLDGSLNITLSGDTPQAGFLSGIVVEPDTSNFAAETEKRRERDFNELWRIVSPLEAGGAPKLTPKNSEELPAVTIALDTGGTTSFLLDNRDWPTDTKIMLGDQTDTPVRAMLWQSIPQLVRSGASTSLVLTDSHLLAIPKGGAAMGAGLTKYTMWISASSSAKPGKYMIPVKLTSADKSQALELTVEVLAASLPPAEKPSGFYLDEAPHVMWSQNPAIARERQLTCDQQFLSVLGINGNAPAVTTPTADKLPAFLADIKRAKELGIVLPALAYAPAKRLFASIEGEAFTASLLAADALADRSAAHALVWSLTDEPSNADSTSSPLLMLAHKLKKMRPTLRFAGHINAKGDEQYAADLDTILVNPGFGVDAPELKALRGDKEIWLYNMDIPRLAAGLFLHSSRAVRYLQWHARMPTADPYDATDGREGDFQMFLPSLNNCPVQPDINEGMLDMAEGLVDQRWLQWLDKQSSQKASALSSRWKSIASQPWATLSKTPEIAGQFRKEVVELARHLKGSP